MALRSYDVFDTVITRLVGDPTSVFLFLGQKALAATLWSGSAEQFAKARVVAEDRARKDSYPEEVTFVQIYEELENAYALRHDSIKRIADLELEIERQLIRVVPEIARELQTVRRNGDVVQFISDMYLPADVLRSWLLDLGVMHSNEVLWVSSAHGSTKTRGGLFDLVRSTRSEGFSHWVHHGDNAFSDIRSAQSRGIDTRHFVQCHLSPGEKVMEEGSVETMGVASLLSGAARWSRLQRAPSDHDAMVDIASGVVAPVIYSFVLWVLLEARKRGLTRIWFMARDGQVMLPVARVIAQRLNISVDIGYLYGGRQLVRVASLKAIDDQALEWLVGGAGLMTLQAVLDRVGVAVAQVSAEAESLGVPTEAVIGWSRIPKLKRFLQHPHTAALILQEAANRREVLLDYFASCGLTGGGSCAVVDIGWRGNVLRSIIDLLGAEQTSRHTFLYFGSFAHAKNSENVPTLGYLFDIKNGKRLGTGADIPSITTLMEIFCQADHGQVMKLERTVNGFRPVCRDAASDKSGSSWDILLLQNIVSEFAETVVISMAEGYFVDLRGVCDRLLRRLATAPTSAEVALLAPIGFVDDQGGSEPHPFAHAYSWRDLRQAFRTGRPAPPIGLNWWESAAVKLTPLSLRWGMKVAAKIGRMRNEGRLFRFGLLREDISKLARPGRIR